MYKKVWKCFLPSTENVKLNLFDAILFLDKSFKDRGFVNVGGFGTDNHSVLSAGMTPRKGK